MPTSEQHLPYRAAETKKRWGFTHGHPPPPHQSSFPLHPWNTAGQAPCSMHHPNPFPNSMQKSRLLIRWKVSIP